MTVSSATQLEGREGQWDSDGNRTYTRRYKVTTTSASETEYDVRNADGLPSRGQSHPDDSQAFVDRVRVTDRAFRGSGRTVWEVEVEYTTRPSRDSPQSQDGEIRITLPRVSYRTVQEQEAVRRVRNKTFATLDDNGNPDGFINPLDRTSLTNSSGQRFRDPPTIDRSSFIIVVEEVLLTFPAGFAQFYVNRVNADNFVMDGYTYAAGTVRMTGWNADKRYIQDAQSVYDNVLEFWYRQDGWQLVLLDEGTAERGQDEQDFRAIRNADGSIVMDPVPLDGQGNAIVGKLDDQDNRPFWLIADVYETATFSNLPLPP